MYAVLNESEVPDPEQTVEDAAEIVDEAGVQLKSGNVVLNNPLPCVAATNVLSEDLYANISVLTEGKVVLLVQTVDVPFIKSVIQTPVSVATIALLLSPG